MKYNWGLLGFSFLLLIACSKERGLENTQTESTKDVLQKIRTISKRPPSGTNSIEVGLYTSIERAANVGYENDIIDVEKILKRGANPNLCFGELGWMDTNPLLILARSSYTTCYRIEKKEIIPSVTPDVHVLQILLKAGANINAFPYVWAIVRSHNNDDIEQVKAQWELDYSQGRASKEQFDSRIKYTVADSNRLLEAFIKAGANPMLRGDPYPFSREAIPKMNDKLAIEYFEKGTLPINEAIEKGGIWVSQVDLLLKYTTLNQESLEAAQRSNDPAMIAKIKKLWAEQNTKS